MIERVIKNAGIYFLTCLLSQGVVFLILILMSRFLQPADLGIYALSLFVINFFGSIAIFGLDAAVVRFYHADYSPEVIFLNSSVIFIFSLIFSLVLFLLSLNFSLFLLPGIYGFVYEHIVLFCFLIAGFSFYCFALFQSFGSRKVMLYSWVNLLQTIIFLIFALIFLFLKLNISGIFYALAISYFFSALSFFFKKIKELSFTLLSFDVVKLLIGYSFPMMIYAVFDVFTLYVGRIFLNNYAGLSTLGIYSFFLVIVLQINSAWSTFNRAWTPEVFYEIKEAGTKKIVDNIKKVTFFSSFLYLALIVVIFILDKSGIFSLFIKQTYLSNIHILYILLIGPLFTGIYMACYPLYYYGKKTKTILLISVILNFFSIVLTLFMVKFFGQVGAALSFSATLATTMLIYIFSFRKSMEIPFEIVNWVIIISVLAIIAVFFLLELSEIYFIAIIVICMISAYKIGKLKPEYFLLKLNDKNV